MVEGNGLQLAPAVNPTDVIVIIVYLVLIVVAAYFLTKFVAKKSLQKGMRNSGMKRKSGAGKLEMGHLVSVVDRVAVDRDKTIMVVEFEGKYYLMSTSPNGLECIDKVEILPEAESQPQPEVSAEDNAKEEQGAVSGMAPEDATQETAAQPAPKKEYPPGEETFLQRFKKCMKIVLRSYLPGGSGANASQGSFQKKLDKEIQKRDSDQNTQKKTKGQ